MFFTLFKYYKREIWKYRINISSGEMKPLTFAKIDQMKVDHMSK